MTKQRMHKIQTTLTLLDLDSDMSLATSAGRPGSRSHDTGYPDWFADRTTSMRHPEANTSPGASISAEDIDPAKTFARMRRSFLAKEHERALSYSKITSDTEKAFNDSGVDLETLLEARLFAEDSIGRPSKDDTDSIGEHTDASGHDEDYSPTQAEHKINSHDHRGGFFRKLRRH